MSIFATAFSLFLISNALGNLPFILSLVKPYPEKKQRAILFREMIFALIILLTFGFFGEQIIHFLGITQGTISIAGGVLLFLLALTMVFPTPEKQRKPVQEEPFLVPIAIPCMAGPGSLAAVMLYGTQFTSTWYLLLVIGLAWGASLAILLTAPLIKRVVGDRGLIAFERFGGLLMCLIATQLFVSGIFKQINLHF